MSGASGTRDEAAEGVPVRLMRLLMSCPDRPGIVAAVSGFLSEAGANIVSSQQHSTDPEGGVFFMRTEFNVAHAAASPAELAGRFQREVAEPFAMEWQLWDVASPKRLAILASRQDHCVLDLLWRRRSGQLDAEIVLVASNHEDLRRDVEAFGVPFHHVPVPRSGDAEAERRLLSLLAGNANVVVLARFMRILSARFLAELAVPVINIHHSFLPAFAGAEAYAQAKRRGVKLIGATAHYVTAELDAGPIIEQDVIRVSHRDSAVALGHLGADIERTVLARAVRWHCEDRVLVHHGTTVVF